MNIRVPAIGPNNAKILIIGEAPGEQEEKQGTPFVGLAGRVLDGLLEEVVIKRDDCYITNVVKFRPPGNNFSAISEGDLAQAKSELSEEITSVHPNVIVPLGEHALRAITDKRGISNWRGSVISTPYGKVIPTYHPAAISREWRFRPISVVDWKKVKKESTYEDIRSNPRNFILNPTLGTIESYLKGIIHTHNKVAFDIEVETQQICCISFATSADYAMCIPFWFGASGSIWSEEQETEIWRLIKEVLEDPSIPKIAQNAQYDMTVLKDLYNIQVRGLWLDTMIAFHSVYPELPKGLDLLCSIYTDVPYYKYMRMTKDMDEFFRYNALDACVTFECAEKIYKEMEEFGITKFYYEHMHSLIEPLLDITAKGVKIDSHLKKDTTIEYKAKIGELQTRLNTAVGHVLNINSPKQMKKWLYEELKLPVKMRMRKENGEATVSADEEVLSDFYASTGNEALKLVLDIRERYKILSTYLEVNYDKGKEVTTNQQETMQMVERAKTSYLITGTETGRLSSRETVYGTGTNMQNIPKGIVRRIFIPDPGKTFINADLSQAEARVVAVLAEEDRLIKVFESGGDIHRKNAANIFRKLEKDVTQGERELAKRLIHASNYGIGPITFAKAVGIPVYEAKKLLNAYFSEYPKIKIWHMKISSQLRKARTLSTPLGRKRTFFNRWDASLLKEAYAYVPQSTVADLLNMGLRRVYDTYKDTETNILLQIHDAILVQSPVDTMDKVAKHIQELMTIPIRVNGHVLVIPVDISVGSNWDELRRIE